jgi:ankyrin repeat protein
MDRWVGATPYWLAAKFLEIEIMDALAEAGADTLRPSRDGSTPLLVAAGVGYRRGGNSAFVTDRRDFSSYNSVASAEEGTKIPEAEERLALATVTHAIEHGAAIDATSGGGDTALHGAASHGMDTVVRYLAEQGADINAQNRRGQTPLDVAVYSEGIGRETFPRESTVALLRSLGGTEGRSTPGGRR